MYTLVTSVLKRRNDNTPWSEVNLNNVKVSEFLNDYISGYVVLTNRSLPGEHIVDYMSFLTGRLPLPLFDLTFPVWLNLINNRVLPTIKEPEFAFGEVWFSEVHKAGWEVQRAHPISPSNDNFTQADLTDGLLIKPSVSMEVYGEYILATQNGLLHYSYPTDRGLKVRDLTKSYYSSKKNSVGVLSFTDVGKIKQIPITEQNLIPVRPDDNMLREFYVDADMDLTGKTVWASIGGYLHTDINEVYSVNNETGLVGFDLKKIDIPRRVAHSSQLIDLSSLGIFLPDWSPTLFNLNELKTREVMQKYLTLTQSFLIVIDTQDIEVTKEELEFTGVVGVYKSPKRRNFAVTNQYGLFQYYASGKLDDEQMAVLVPPDLMSYNDYDTEGWTLTPLYGEDYRLRYGDRYPSLYIKRIQSTSMVRL